MEEEIIKDLSEIGFTFVEARVYYALVESGFYLNLLVRNDNIFKFVLFPP